MERADAWHLTDRIHNEHGKGDPFAAAVRATRMAMIVTDPRQHDNPIVFVNDAFLKLSGYSREKIMGKNCRFLQGEKTDPGAVQKVRNAISGRRDIAIDLLNYRKDGAPFWNALYVSPVINEGGELLYFFASQLDVSDRVNAQQRTLEDKEHFEREVAKRTRELTDALAAKTMLIHEVDHRVKNNLQMIASLLAMQTRAITDPAARAAMEGMRARVEALGTVHRRLYQSKNVERFDVAAFARDLATDLIEGSGRGIRLHLDLEAVEIPVEKAPPVALIMNELITNTLKHAFPGERSGRLSITVAPAGNYFGIKIVDDGVGMPAEVMDQRSFGKRLTETLARQLNATIAWSSTNPGTLVNIRVPLTRRKDRTLVTEPLSVLIVEDEAILQMHLEMLLEDAGHTVVGVATTASQAVALISEKHPELVLLDLNLEGSSGLDVARYARDLHHVAIVFITANALQLDDEMEGALGLIAKPFTGKSLAGSIAYLEECVHRPPPVQELPCGIRLAPAYQARIDEMRAAT